MPRYEYKVVTIPINLGFDFEQKCRQLEESMNELGAEGWKFCASLNGAFLLMREVVQIGGGCKTPPGLSRLQKI